MKRSAAGLFALLASSSLANAQVYPIIIPNTGTSPAPTPSGLQSLISGTPWINGIQAIGGRNWRDNYQEIHDILNGMGTWNGSGVFTPNLAPGTVVANLGFTPLSNGGDTASGVLGVAAGGTCDTSQWAAALLNGAAAIPQPTCYASKIAPTISIPFAGVAGINAPSGAANDQTHIQYAGALDQFTTALDNNHQEAARVINFVSQTGGGTITNWNEKVGLLVYALAKPGSGNAWAINDDIVGMSGLGTQSLIRHEGDMTNFNGPYPPGGCSPCTGGQINSFATGDYLTYLGYPITAGTTYASAGANAGSFNMSYGILFQALSGFTALGTGLVNTATINDSTNSLDVLQVYGTHTNGLDTTPGTVPYPVLAKQGQKISLNGLGASGPDANWSYVGSNTTRFTQNNGTPLSLVGAADGINTTVITSAPAGYGPTVSAAPTGGDTNVPLNLAGYGTSPVQVLSNIVLTQGLNAPALPTSGGTVEGTMCIDTTGNIYVKTTTGACK